MSVRLHFESGATVSMDVDRWTGPATSEERALLRSAIPPVLDVGCGPGRHVVELAEQGIVALGVDVSPIAVELARSTGAPVLKRSIFDSLPAAGRWGTTLLLDGNIGIGGEPRTLLSRLRELLRLDGCALVELAGPGLKSMDSVAWIENDGMRSSTFPWARVSVDAIHELASASGFLVWDLWTENKRWFARLNAC
jgi:SAM-dependent methyltransferase